MYQSVFKRYELKYMLSRSQAERVISRMEPYMKVDDYGKTTIRNLYFDTDTYLLIRRSIEKPVFKEKLRLRSYSKAYETDTVFAELKRKYDGVVYKRRMALPRSEAMAWLCRGERMHEETQISREIDYFLSFYKNLHPTVFLSYDRVAYYSLQNDGFRVTFDDNITARDSDMSLGSEVYGVSLLDADKVLMEIKCFGSIPLWMADILSEERIYKTSFSKYGEAYSRIIFPKLQESKTSKITEGIGSVV